MSLSFDQIIEKSPKPTGPKTLAVPVPHWGGDVTLRKLTAGEFITFNARFERMADDAGNITDQAHIGAAMLWLVATTAVDDQGQQIFNTMERVEKLNSDAEALVILGAQALAFNKREAPAPKNEEPTLSQSSG
jgi:hypothetical protein